MQGVRLNICVHLNTRRPSNLFWYETRRYEPLKVRPMHIWRTVCRTTLPGGATPLQSGPSRVLTSMLEGVRLNDSGTNPGIVTLEK